MILCFNCYTFRKCLIKNPLNIASNRSSISLIIVVLLIKQGKNVYFNFQRISKSIHILYLCKSTNSANQSVSGGLNDPNAELQIRSYICSQLHYTVILRGQFKIRILLKQSSCGILDRGVERGRSRGSRDCLKPQCACVQAYLQISAITT